MKAQTFRLSRKATAWECLGGLFLAIFSLGFVFLIGAIVLETSKGKEAGVLRIVLHVIFGLPALVIIITAFITIFTGIGRALFSYLLISEDGLEYSLSPGHKIRCSWEDVDKIKKSFLPFQGDILMLKSAEASGLHKHLLRFNKGEFGAVKTLPLIPLYQIDGWQNGRLKNEIIKYSPGLFVEQSES